MPGSTHTLRRPILSQQAAHAFFAGRTVNLPSFAGGPDSNGKRPSALFTEEFPAGQPIPENVLSDVTRHVCKLQRINECATWLARWRSDYPDSKEARAFDPREVNKLGSTPGVQPQVIDQIEAAFRGKSPPTPHAKNPVARATQLTNFFSSHYVHAIPFDRRLLGDAWSDCRGRPDTNARCQQARQRWNETLERFEMPDAPLAGAGDGG